MNRVINDFTKIDFKHDGVNLKRLRMYMYMFNALSLDISMQRNIIIFYEFCHCAYTCTFIMLSHWIYLCKGI